MHNEIDDIAQEKLKRAVDEAFAHIEKAIEALPFLVALTADERQHSSGKFKDGEERAISAIVDAVERNPKPFASLHFDPGHVAALLARRALLAPIAERATHFADDLTDTLLHLGEAIRASASSAYHVASALAPHDEAIASALQPAREFYQSTGRAAARTRRAHRSHPAPTA